jgi:hypothetical protein
LRPAATESVVATARPPPRQRLPRTYPHLAARSAPAALRPPCAPRSARSSGRLQHARMRVRGYDSLLRSFAAGHWRRRADVMMMLPGAELWARWWSEVGGAPLWGWACTAGTCELRYGRGLEPDVGSRRWLRHQQRREKQKAKVQLW